MWPQSSHRFEPDERPRMADIVEKVRRLGATRCQKRARAAWALPTFGVIKANQRSAPDGERTVNSARRAEKEPIRGAVGVCERQRRAGSGPATNAAARLIITAIQLVGDPPDLSGGCLRRQAVLPTPERRNWRKTERPLPRRDLILLKKTPGCCHRSAGDELRLQSSAKPLTGS